MISDIVFVHFSVYYSLFITTDHIRQIAFLAISPSCLKKTHFQFG